MINLQELYQGAVIFNSKNKEVSPKKCVAPFTAALKEYKAKFIINAITKQSTSVDGKIKHIYSNVLVLAVLPFQSADETYNMAICLTYRIDSGVKIYRCWYDVKNQSFYVNNSQEIHSFDFDNIDYSCIENLIQLSSPHIDESKSFKSEDMKKILGSLSIDCSSLTLSISKDKVKLAENLPIRCFKRLQKRHFLESITVKDLRQEFSFLLIEDMKKDIFNIYEKALLINTLLNENC